MKDPTKSVTDVYDTIAHQYASQYDVAESSDLKFVDKFLDQLPRGSNILDVGCGDGRDTKYMIEKGFIVTGIDLSEQLLAIARKRSPKSNFQQMDIRDLSFKDNTFDGLISSFSLIHVQKNEILKTMKGFQRVLKSGGKVTIFAQQGESDHYVVEPFAPEMKTFFNFFSENYLRQQLSDAGFKDIEILSEHCDDPYNMSDTNLYVFAKNA